jgi:hypothetical protein
MAIMEHDRVVLTTPVPSEGLEPGDVGAVVHVYADGWPSKWNLLPWTDTPRRLSRSKRIRCDRSQDATSPMLEQCLQGNGVPASAKVSSLVGQASCLSLRDGTRLRRFFVTLRSLLPLHR